MQCTKNLPDGAYRSSRPEAPRDSAGHLCDRHHHLGRAGCSAQHAAAAVGRLEAVLASVANRPVCRIRTGRLERPEHQTGYPFCHLKPRVVQ